MEQWTNDANPVLAAFLVITPEGAKLKSTCTFCPDRGAVCNCVDVLAGNPIRVFKYIFKTCVDPDSSKSSSLQLPSHPLPACAYNAMYNVTGFLLHTRRRQADRNGAQSDDDTAFAAFCVAHTMFKNVAEQAGLSVDKQAVRREHFDDSFAHASREFFCLSLHGRDCVLAKLGCIPPVSTMLDRM